MDQEQILRDLKH